MDSQTTSVSQHNSAFPLCIALCIGFVVVADWFFWEAPVGWTLGGYGLLLMAAVLLTGEGRANRMGVATVTTAVAVLCLYCFEEPSLLIVLMGILGLATLGLLLREGWGHSVLVWFERWARMVMIGWLTPSLPPGPESPRPAAASLDERCSRSAGAA